MINTPKKIATQVGCVRATAVFCFILVLILLGGCSGLPLPPSQPVVYDLGPQGGEAYMNGSPSSERPLPLAPLVLAEVEGAGSAEGNTTVQYRLAYSNAQQLRAYQRARWSLPPAQLVQHHLRGVLGERHAVLRPEDAQSTLHEGASVPAVLRIELEEFSHLFTSASHSTGLVRLRATLTQPTPTGARLLGQRVFIVQTPAASADAAGGVHALAQATAQAAQGIAQWIEEAVPSR